MGVQASLGERPCPDAHRIYGQYVKQMKTTFASTCISASIQPYACITVLASYSYFIVLTTESKKWKQILSNFIRWPWHIGTSILCVDCQWHQIYVYTKQVRMKNFDQMFEKMSTILAFFQAYYASMDHDASIVWWASPASTWCVCQAHMPAHQYRGWQVWH